MSIRLIYRITFIIIMLKEAIAQLQHVEKYSEGRLNMSLCNGVVTASYASLSMIPGCRETIRCSMLIDD